MGCHLSPSLISIGLTAWACVAVHAVPPSRGIGGLTKNKQQTDHNEMSATALPALRVARDGRAQAKFLAMLLPRLFLKEHRVKKCML